MKASPPGSVSTPVPFIVVPGSAGSKDTIIALPSSLATARPPVEARTSAGPAAPRASTFIGTDARSPSAEVTGARVGGQQDQRVPSSNGLESPRYDAGFDAHAKTIVGSTLGAVGGLAIAISLYAYKKSQARANSAAVRIAEGDLTIRAAVAQAQLTATELTGGPHSDVELAVRMPIQHAVPAVRSTGAPTVAATPHVATKARLSTIDESQEQETVDTA